MKSKFFYYIFVVLGLQGCEHAPVYKEIPFSSPTELNQFEQLVIYGEKFTVEFEKNPLPVCRKYISRHREGDWRAAWVLALAVAKKNSALCLNTKDAVYTLTSLLRQKKMSPHLTWLTRFHLRQLRLLQKRDQKIAQLTKAKEVGKKTSAEHEKTIAELELEKSSLREKLKALKAIEFSINQ